MSFSSHRSDSVVVVTFGSTVVVVFGSAVELAFGSVLVLAFGSAVVVSSPAMMNLWLIHCKCISIHIPTSSCKEQI